jgi:hypothetical protein
MNRASLRNEGKVHLGLVYAKDPATALFILQGALHFHPLLRNWLGPAFDQVRASTPFHYLVAHDSILSTEQLEKHYASVEAEYQQLLEEHPGLDYLGKRPAKLFTRMTSEEIAKYFRKSRVPAAFQTAELSIDPEQLALMIRQAIQKDSRIEFLPGHCVKGVKRRNGFFNVEGSNNEGTWQLDAQQVVNATWESRLMIDRSVGLEPIDGWLHRLKYRVIARLPQSLRNAPSVTMVIGRYGDVVVRSDGTVYLSWYPLALQGWSHDLQPPESWNDPCRGLVPQIDSRKLSTGILQEIDSWFPGIANAEPIQVDAGVIFAYGYTDVDHAMSGLHNRTKIGVTSLEGYHTVNTGKLTTAPLFAMAAADHVMNWKGVCQ